MILIADSGSTKTEWCFANEKGTVKKTTTPGINPFYQTEDEIIDLLKTHFKSEGFNPTSSIFFYGAGCINDEKQNLVKSALERTFKTTSINVESDLLAAARALCGQEQGIACILGTGSNSCLFDGKQIVRNVSPLGFILGDEGSGAVLGRRLIGNILKQQFPTDITDRFNSQYQLNPVEILNKVYRQPFPNRFLAGFAPFIKENIGEPLVHEMVLDEFNLFITRNLFQYPGVNHLPVHFTGSIAWHFSDILKDAMEGHGLNAGKILQSPMEGLVKFHCNET